MSTELNPAVARSGQTAARLHSVLLGLPKDGPELRAIKAGEIDAVIDYAHTNAILFPAARHALRNVAIPASNGNQEAANDAQVANSLLAALPSKEYQQLLPNLDFVSLKFGEILHEPGQPMGYVYFPIDCVVCLLANTGSQRAVEVGLVGYEGMVGVSLALGVDLPSARAEVLAAGMALRMQAARFGRELRHCPQLRRQLLQYTHAKLAQARQTAGCFGCHLFETRLACWLLMTTDRVRSDEIFLTQEYLAALFGVRRVTVTMACVSLRARELIGYSRGTITILDRKGLEAVSCCCYTKIEARHRRIQPDTVTPDTGAATTASQA